MPDYLVKRSGTKKFTVTQEKTVVAENLSELADVSVSNLPGSDKFVLAYNASLAKFELIPADSVLTAAANDAQILLPLLLLLLLIDQLGWCLKVSQFGV